MPNQNKYVNKSMIIRFKYIWFILKKNWWIDDINEVINGKNFTDKNTEDRKSWRKDYRKLS